MLHRERMLIERLAFTQIRQQGIFLVPREHLPFEFENATLSLENTSSSRGASRSGRNLHIRHRKHSRRHLRRESGSDQQGIQLQLIRRGRGSCTSSCGVMLTSVGRSRFVGFLSLPNAYEFGFRRTE